MKRLRPGALVLMLAVAAALLVPGSSQAEGEVSEYIRFRKFDATDDFVGASANHVEIVSDDEDARVELKSSGLPSGSDKKLYKVKAKSFFYGTLESAQTAVSVPFDTAIASWNASTPAGTWIQVELRAFRPADGHWTKYYNLGIWASESATIERHSVARQGDADGFVATDTLLLYGAAAYTQYQWKLTLFTLNQSISPTVDLLSVMTSDSAREPGGLAIATDWEAWGTDLAVPMRSQMIYKGGGEVWCSPTSTSMVLAYWGYDLPVPDAADATYDYVYEGNGNWPFNTAWAATKGLEAYVTRMGSMAQIEEWISVGVPVIISYAFGVDELEGTPIASSAGHIMVVRGFDATGNVIVNDPAAAADDAVRIVYDREALERLWLTHSGGTVYLIYPKHHPTPTDKALGSW